MSDEISILTHISEENPTAASPSSVTETGFVADSQRPHAISDRASVAFTGWHNAAHAAAPASVTWRAARHTSKPRRRFSHTALQHDFANAKTAFTTVTTTALFFCFIAACALLSWHGFSAFVNGGNDFNAEFGKSNSGYILRWFPKADGHDDKRALS
ncbi:hypothetical protein [Dickeya dianthicola]|uniref:hypothetical protein n=1 Tax=Dickeya dianthicola TaxID=204039 RepID=UPI000A543AEE|nr:hypothetical protein [Dickeya dianthicola]MBT1428384.1 hypothetical protein [Dickeya dianthicola]MBT1432454.1 hypothetical protein [Dickeya dianthicola]MBT1459902.1 hypothetical protein [Dickeya dianthicola]MBT1489100.1 hypothetical protein [Dickeya dianthicola]MCA7005264.1 hypothetical protein [Dickeya dianthicola]